MKRFLFLIAATTGALTLSAASSANAHIVIENFKGRAGYNEFLTLMVPHGCGPAPTTELRMKIPEGISPAVPEQKEGWETQVIMKKLDEPIRGEGGRMISEVVDEFVWRGNLPTNQLGTFKFLARMPAKVGSVVAFKTIQKCGDEEVRWVDAIDEGQEAWEMWINPEPAPFVEVITADGPQLGASMEQLQAARQAQVQGASRE